MLLGLLCLWQCLNPAQAKRSGGGMGGVDQAQVILSQLNATNKVNSKLSLCPLFCVILSVCGPRSGNLMKQMYGEKLRFHKLQILHLKFSVPQDQKQNFNSIIFILTADCFQENLAWSRK